MGGAIFNDAGSVSLTNTTLSGNAANGSGSSIGGASNGSRYGGALFNYNGTLTLDFVTLSANSVAAGSDGVVGSGSPDGGAIYSLGDSAANCSAGGNPCLTPGTSTVSSGATLSLVNSIAAGNTGGSNDIVIDTRANGVGASSGTGGGKLIGAQSSSHSATSTIGKVNTTVTDPQLGALAPTYSSGGFGLTMLPQPGSPVIDVASDCMNAAGAVVTTDQRGFARPKAAHATSVRWNCGNRQRC